jgi:hypothetical protein
MASFNQTGHDTRLQGWIQHQRDLNVQTKDSIHVGIDQAIPPPFWTLGANATPLKVFGNTNPSLFEIQPGSPEGIFVHTNLEPGGYLLHIRIIYEIDQSATGPDLNFGSPAGVIAGIAIGPEETLLTYPADWRTTLAQGDVAGGFTIIRADRVFYFSEGDTLLLKVFSIGWTGTSGKIKVTVDMDVVKL